MILEKIIECYPEEEFMVADGFDEAIIGVDMNTMKIIYSYKKCIDILVNKDGMTYSDALEYFVYNVSGSYNGENTPIWCNDDFIL